MQKKKRSQVTAEDPKKVWFVCKNNVSWPEKCGEFDEEEKVLIPVPFVPLCNGPASKSRSGLEQYATGRRRVSVPWRK